MPKAPTIKGFEDISIVKDPFNKSSMTTFRVYCHKSILSDDWSYNGAVEFKNGDTEGEQNFKGNSLKNVLVKMQAFVESLEEKA